jgi:uncharacterized protein (PEP-CTERM system associated)
VGLADLVDLADLGWSCWGGSEFITQINPGVNLTGNGRRFNANANYTLNSLFFANSGRTLIRQQLNSKRNC